MYTVTKSSTKAQITSAYEAMRDALDAERQAHDSTKRDLEELRALRAAAVAKAKAARAEVTPCEAPKHEEIEFVEPSETPSTVAEFCEWYTRVNGVKSVPKSAVDTWKKAFARTCIKCGGTGRYVYADGGTGDCYACTGNGKQTHADVTRCSAYWKLYGQP